MSNRALRIGDRIVARPGSRLAKAVGIHNAGVIVDAARSMARRWIVGKFGEDYVDAWISEVRLADGATERADVRFEARAKETEAMKRARRKQKKGARKS
jgi:hypothetical protein